MPHQVLLPESLVAVHKILQRSSVVCLPHVSSQERLKRGRQATVFSLQTPKMGKYPGLVRKVAIHTIESAVGEKICRNTLGKFPPGKV
jgi:hypothetical protein